MVQEFNPDLDNIVRRNTPESGVHDEVVDAFDGEQPQAYSEVDSSEEGDVQSSTADGIVIKTVICLSLVLLTAVAEAALCHRSPRLGTASGVGGVVAGLAIISVISNKTKGFVIPYLLAFSVSQGLLVGLIAHELLVMYFIGYPLGTYILGITGTFIGLLVLNKIEILRESHYCNHVIFGSLAGTATILLGTLVLSLTKGIDPLDLYVMPVMLMTLLFIAVIGVAILTIFARITVAILTEDDWEDAWLAASGFTIAIVWSWILLPIIPFVYQRIIDAYEEDE